MSVVLPAGYGYVVFSLGVLGLVQLGIGGSVMKYRKHFKSQEFKENPKVKELQEAHKKAFGTPINDMGYPDMGSGLYSHLLPYDKWVEFNNAQRAHYNMIESSGPFAVCVACVGFYFPRTTAILSLTYSVGRVVYTMGYNSKKGADGRRVGVILADVALLGVYGMAMYFGLSNAGFLGEMKSLLGR